MNPFRSPQSKRTPLAAVPTPKGEGSVQLRLYDPIDSWGGDWGISAREFAEAVDSLPEGTDEIRLLINSPGGEVWDGLAILNMLRSHPARVVAVVEGIAASAASFIAAGADEVVMMRNSEMFIHNAWGFAMGDAEVMESTAEDLSHLDRNLAAIYAEKSGKSVEYWLAEMPKDRWLSAEEAVEAGLADRIEGVGDAAAARARFDLSVFARREPAPAAALAAELPSSSEPGETNRKENVVAYDELTAGLRERLGVTDADASDEQILAALDEALAEQAENDEAVEVPEGAVIVDAAAYEELRTHAEAGRQARAEQISARRDGIVARAIEEGRIAPAAREQWRALLDDNEDRTAALISAMPVGTIPVDELGHADAGESSEDDRLYAQAWGSTEKEA